MDIIQKDPNSGERVTITIEHGETYEENPFSFRPVESIDIDFDGQPVLLKNHSQDNAL